MTAPPIAGSNRYIPEGTTEFYWVTSMANYQSPLRSELDAGTNLTPELADAGDWAINGSTVDTPDLATLFTSQAAGKVTMGTTTINMYADPSGTDARALMPRGTRGYIVKFTGGDITGRKMDVFPVLVLSAAKPTALTNPITVDFTYAVSKIPAEDVPVP